MLQSGTLVIKIQNTEGVNQMRNKLLSVVAVLAIAGSANAADMSKWYAQADVGYGWSTDAKFKNSSDGQAGTTLDGNLNEIGKSASYTLGVGYYVRDNIRVGLAYSYRGGFEINDVDSVTPTTSFKGDITSQAFMATSAYEWKFSNFTPYVGVGLGMASNKVKSFSAYDSVGAASASLSGGTETSFAYELMAGIGYDITPKWTVDAGYNYVDLGDIKTDPTIGFGVNGTKGSLKAHEVKLGLRYKF